MDDAPDFDEDDLINDYAQQQDFDDDLQPENEYYDELMGEQEVTVAAAASSVSNATTNNNNTATATNNTSTPTTTTTTAASPTFPLEPVDVDNADADNNNDNNDAREVHAERQRRNNNDGGFTFERYNHKNNSNSCWRRDKTDSPSNNVMKAKKWKAAAADVTTKSNSNKKRSLVDDFMNNDDDDDDFDDDDFDHRLPFQRRKLLQQRRKQQQRQRQAATATAARCDEMPTAPDSQLLYFSSRPNLATVQQQQQQQQQQQRYCADGPTSSSSSSSRRSSAAALTMLSRPVPGQATRSMTLGNGTRVFMRVRDDTTLVRRSSYNSSNSNSNNNQQHCALGIFSMPDLMKRVQRMRRLQQHENPNNNIYNRSLQAVNENDDDDHDDDGDDITTMDTPTTTTTPLPLPPPPDDHQLWVDKHAPASFLHLLSNEKTNREVIRALRAWDKYVFHKDPPSRPDFFQNHSNNNNNINNNINNKNPSSPSSGKTTKTKDNRNNNNSNFMIHHPNNNNNNKQNPKDTRPDASARVLLLSGPPGVGKSTLAHIVARHCGYRPLEVNGSDERSASVLQDRVTRAMESHTLDNMRVDGSGSSSSCRPNCLILDEIDGVDASGAIQALVDIIRAERPPSNKGAAAADKKKNKSSCRKKKITYLRRPIIFICNNKFAPALQPLLPYCRQFHVNPPSSTRLVARLRAVLAVEGVSVSSSGGTSSSNGNAALLHQLVATSGGDIRSCLYTLQFAAAKAKRMAIMAHNQNSKLGKETVVDISETLGASLSGKGLKDARSDIFGVVTSIFCNNRARRDKNGRSSCDGILDLLQSFGDNSRTLDCLFLNVMNVSYIDPTMDKCAAAHEWLSSAGTHRSHDGVESSAAAAVHLLCRVEQQRQMDLVFSTRTMSQARYDREANQALAMRFIQGLDPQAARCTRCATTLVAVETTPYALWILSAGNADGCLDRAASNVDLLNDRERTAFDSHVAVLSALGLTYVADENQDEVTALSSSQDRRKQPDKVRLEPPIENFVQFQDFTCCERREIPPQLKDLLARKAAHDRLQKRRVDKDVALKNDATDLAETSQTVGLSKTGPLQLDVTAVDALQSTQANDPPSAEERESPNKRTAGASPSPLDNSKLPPVKKQKATEATTLTSSISSSSAITSANFLGVGARKAKAARTAQKLARAGFQRSNKNKFSHTGSGVPLRQAMRLKYVKGFTQAVRVPCRLEDLA